MGFCYSAARLSVVLVLLHFKHVADGPEDVSLAAPKPFSAANTDEDRYIQRFLHDTVAGALY